MRIYVLIPGKTLWKPPSDEMYYGLGLKRALELSFKNLIFRRDEMCP